MTSAVIIILREVIEAVIIIGILLAAGSAMAVQRGWIPVSIACGLLGAAIYAAFFDVITDAFSGIGQEILNSSLLFGISASLVLVNYYAFRAYFTPAFTASGRTVVLAILVAITCSITREGAEIYIYLSGYLGIPDLRMPIITGSAIGAGIGLSTGALFYFGLMSLRKRNCLLVSGCVLTLLAAGLASQGALYLIQADILSSQLPLWDTSSLLPESSLIGELLYALVSYEATPTATQVLFYFGAITAMAAAIIASSRLSSISRR